MKLMASDVLRLVGFLLAAFAFSMAADDSVNSSCFVQKAYSLGVGFGQTEPHIQGLSSTQEDWTRIPKIIHLTHKTINDMRPEAIPRLQDQNPSFSIKFYNDSIARDFIQAEFGDAHVQVWDRIQVKAHKADFFRYCVLYRLGGYYVDADNVMLAPVDALSGSFDFVSVLANTQFGIHVHNGFLASVPRNPILLDQISFFLDNPNPSSTFVGLKYHYYVRYFLSSVNQTLQPRQLKPFTPYDINGLRVNFLYAENLGQCGKKATGGPVIDRDRRPLMNMGGWKAWSHLTEGAVSEFSQVPSNYPDKFNLTTMEWMDLCRWI